MSEGEMFGSFESACLLCVYLILIFFLLFSVVMIFQSREILFLEST